MNDAPSGRPPDIPCCGQSTPVARASDLSSHRAAYPFVTDGTIPVPLLHALPLRMLSLPQGLPVPRPGIADPRQDQGAPRPRLPDYYLACPARSVSHATAPGPGGATAGKTSRQQIAAGRSLPIQHFSRAEHTRQRTNISLLSSASKPTPPAVLIASAKGRGPANVSGNDLIAAARRVGSVKSSFETSLEAGRI